MSSKKTNKAKDYDYLFKLVLIGDSGVGKSCLLLRFAVSRASIYCYCVVSVVLLMHLFAVVERNVLPRSASRKSGCFFLS